MIEIKKKFIKDAEIKTHEMVSELCQMIYETYMNDRDTYKKILNECNIPAHKLSGLIFGDLREITLSEYNFIEAYLSSLNREILNKIYNLNANDKLSDSCCGDTCKNGNVVGNFCENCDKFAIDRNLPKVDMGDYLVIHDTGAHGFSMGYNYNGKLRSAELLLQEDGSVKMIRRAETPADYFATFDCFDDIKITE